MRLDINMLSHPPQPFIIVCACVFVDRRQGVSEVVGQRKRGDERQFLTLTVAHKHIHILVNEDKHAPAYMHELIRPDSRG